MVLDHPPELKIAYRSDVSWLERCQLKVAILFGCHSKLKRLVKAPAGKEDPLKRKEGKKTL